MRFIAVSFLSAFLATYSCHSFDLSGKLTGPLPVEIDSQQGITCEEKGRVCTARGDVIVTRGQAKLRTDILKATFSLNEKGAPSDLIRLEAKGNARFSTTDNSKKGQAQRVTYDVLEGHTRLTGGNLKLYADGLTVTAEKAIDYYENGSKAVAAGKARAWKEGKIITAETLTAYFKEGQEGKLVLHHVVAEGDVLITMPQNMAQGAKAVYHVHDETARLTGKVRLTRSEGQIEGSSAEVNLVTGVGRVLSHQNHSEDQSGNKRVKVLLRPKEKKS